MAKAKYAGVCAVNDQHTWKENEDYYIYPRSGKWDDKSQGWIMCKDKECFEKQGGKIPEKKPFGGGRKPMSQMIEELVPFEEALYTVARNRLTVILADFQDSANIDANQKLIFIESWARTLAQGVK